MAESFWSRGLYGQDLWWHLAHADQVPWVTVNPSLVVIRSLFQRAWANTLFWHGAVVSLAKIIFILQNLKEWAIEQEHQIDKAY